MGNKERIYIGGVGCVGKTTVGRELAKLHGARHFSGSEVMMGLCGVISKDQLSSIPREEKETLEREEYPNFLESYPGAVVDGHCELYKEQAGCFGHFIFLTAPPETVQERRGVEGRRNGSLQAIQAEQEDYLRRVKNTEKRCGIKFTPVHNTGTVNDTCGLIKQIIEQDGK